MASMDMDKSLDEIIASKPKGGRRGGAGGAARRRSTGRQQILGKAAPAPAQKTRAAAAAVQPGKVTAAQPALADKIIVSNLPIDVNEAQVKELFASTVGPLRDVTLHYDANGKSKGVAAVHFSRKGDANKAYTQYNNRLIDGKRPMKIEIVVDPIKAVPLSARVAPPAAAAPAATRGGPAARRRRGGRGGGAGAKRSERPQKTAADLDAEMEDYTAAASAPAAAPAAAAA
ncbi:RNA annealing factor [Coprinopsis cinerea okayama7|uniref:RNA annealing factor n=1 Tax=Coprinopsis cinerea (strain Okayama-7 / 130 / ATCC MYA-4618 / FGSC 9003) TaxID=240176 RepID=A8NBY0_COPC7|nr:RNA annealing factor [Coprinopsis cinerea okayama7\|eukprot:XP_001832340.1 RNA annealing factor [Coprinopsis cinerea okayama7\